MATEHSKCSRNQHRSRISLYGLPLTRTRHFYHWLLWKSKGRRQRLFVSYWNRVRLAVWRVGGARLIHRAVGDALGTVPGSELPVGGQNPSLGPYHTSASPSHSSPFLLSRYGSRSPLINFVIVIFFAWSAFQETWPTATPQPSRFPCCGQWCPPLIFTLCPYPLLISLQEAVVQSINTDWVSDFLNVFY